MLMKWEDLEPGDKIKFTPELKNIIISDKRWKKKVWLDWEIFEIEKVKTDGNFLLIWLKEHNSCFWITTFDGKIFFYKEIPAFEIVDLGE